MNNKIQNCINRLQQISISNEQPNNEDRDCYMGEYRKEVEQIGQLLHELGGYELMLNIYSMITVKYELDRGEIKYVWNGIGNWKV